MTKASKGLAPAELVQLRAVLAMNLRAYMAAKYGRLMPETSAAIEIGDATKLGKNTVLRALGKGGDEVDIRLDTLVRLALHFDVTPLDLLHDHGMAKAQAANTKAKKHTARDQRMDADVDRAPLQRGRRA